MSRLRTVAWGAISRRASSTAWAARMWPAPTDADRTRIRGDWLMGVPRLGRRRYWICRAWYREGRAKQLTILSHRGEIGAGWLDRSLEHVKLWRQTSLLAAVRARGLYSLVEIV